MSWKYTRTCSDKKNCQIFGISIYDFPWSPTGETATVKDPMGDLDRSVEIWEITLNGQKRRFAVGEFLPGIYSFYLDTEEDDELTAVPEVISIPEQPKQEIGNTASQQTVRYCKYCGKPLNQNSLFCPHCGVKVDEVRNDISHTYEFGNRDRVATVRSGNSSTENPLAIAGFVVSLVSIVFRLFGLISITGIVLSSIGLYNANQKGKDRKGLAIAGLVVGICTLVLTVVLMIFAITVIDSMGDYY